MRTDKQLTDNGRLGARPGNIMTPPPIVGEGVTKHEAVCCRHWARSTLSDFDRSLKICTYIKINAVGYRVQWRVSRGTEGHSPVGRETVEPQMLNVQELYCVNKLHFHHTSVVVFLRVWRRLQMPLLTYLFVLSYLQHRRWTFTFLADFSRRTQE